MKRTYYDIFGSSKPKQAAPSEPSSALPSTEFVPDSSQAAPSDVSRPQMLGQAEPDTSSSTQICSLDIGDAVDNKSLTDKEKLSILERTFKPPEGFVWPFTERKDGENVRRKYLGPQHFTGKLDVFSYSMKYSGIFCKQCVLFAPDTVGGVKLARLVKSPVQKYAHLTGKDGKLTSHLSTEFHEDSAQRAQAFMKTVKDNAGSVLDQLDKAGAAKRAKNRAALGRIILAIEFHGRLGLPLRGHRDFGPLLLPDPSGFAYDQGNLRAVLQLMADSGDSVLRDHFATTGQNSTYISPLSQNALIDSMGTVFLSAIVSQIEEARFFSLLADETTDFSHQEQLVVCLRYVSADFAIMERFLCFALAPDLSGLGLATQLISILQSAGINCDNMVGQGYDGASAMSGKNNGVQYHIRQQCPAASYVHCASHALNLCMLKAAEIPEIRAAVTLMHEIAVFYTDSNKRLLNLQEFIKSECPESRRTRLKKHCSTRWVEKQEAVSVFKEILPAVLASLDALSAWPGETGGKAAIFLRSLYGSFYIALEILDTVLEVTKPLSTKLQSVAQDIHVAASSIKDCEAVLNQFRNEDGFFKGIFERAEALNGEPLQMPRISSRQRHRSNIPAESPMVYFKRAVYFPFIDTCLGQLHERFSKHAAAAYQISVVIPSFCHSSTFSDLGGACEHYGRFLNGHNIEVEFMRWKAYWDRVPTGDRPSQVIDALRHAAQLGTYPGITILLRIFATIPVTTATEERAFSSLKFIKAYLRSTMTVHRLNGLAHLYINRDLKLDHEKVIEDFSKTNRRHSFA